MKKLIKMLLFVGSVFVVGCDCKKSCQTQAYTQDYNVGLSDNVCVPTSYYYEENNRFDVGVRYYSYDYHSRVKYFDSGYGSFYDPYRSYDYSHYDSGYRPYINHGYTYSDSYSQHRSERYRDESYNRRYRPPTRHREENSCPSGYYRPQGR